MSKRLWKRLGNAVSLVIAVVLVGYAMLRWNDVSARVSNAWVIFSQPQYLTGLDSAQTILDFAAERPNDIAIASYTVGQDGTETGDAVLHNANEPMPLASTMKIVVLAAYAQAVTQGQLDPQQTVPLAEWERFYLPGTDGGAHAATLEEFAIAADSRGFAQDQVASVPLDRLVWAMIRYSDNAATDYLVQRLGDQAIQATVAAAGLQGQEPIQPLDGTFLSWENHEQNGPNHTQALLANDDATYRQEVERLQEAYGQPAWRAAELAWPRPAARISDQARLAERFMPKGTARDYANIMAGVVSGTFLSPQVSALMRPYLEWPMQKAGNQERFSAFGAKGGSVAGVVTNAMFLIPKQGDFAGKPRVVVVFLRNLPPAAWLRLGQTFAEQDLAVAIATERSVQEQTARQFSAQP